MQSNENFEWVSNVYEAPKYYYTIHGQSAEKSLEFYWQWRSRLQEGDPKAMGKYSVQQLKNMGLIGLYRNI